VIREILCDGGDQRWHTAERSSTKAVACEIPEPALDHIQPRARCRNEMKMNPWMTPQPRFHFRMFMSGIIIHDHMKIQSRRSFGIDLLEKTNKFLVPVPRHAIADHFSIQHAEGSEQRRRSVTNVIMRHSSAAAFLHRQPRLRSVERLDLAFLVDTQNQGFFRRIQIQAHDVTQLLDKTLVSTEFEGFDPMGLQVVLLPDPADGRFADILRRRHRPRAPMSRRGRFCLKRSFDHDFDFLGSYPRKSTRSRGVLLQTCDAKSQKSLTPQLNRRPRNSQTFGNLLALCSLSCQSNDLGSLNQTQRERSSLSPSVQSRLLLGRKDDGWGCSAHHPKLYPQIFYMSIY